jgi:hypothetical protein
MEGTTEKRVAPGGFVSWPSGRSPAQCLIKPEPQVTAFIPPPIVQAPFRIWELNLRPMVSYARPVRPGFPPEDIEMFTRKALLSSCTRTAALASVAALALTAFEPSTARAGTVAPAKGLSATSGTSDATDISARRRIYRGGGGAAAAAAFAGIVGTGLAIAASQDRGYYGGPAYYGGGPYESYGYYGGPPAYYGDGGYGYYGGGYGYRSGVPHYRGHPLAGW